MRKLIVIILTVSLLDCNHDSDKQTTIIQSKPDAIKKPKWKIQKCYKIKNGKKELTELKEYNNKGLLIKHYNSLYSQDRRFVYDNRGNKIEEITYENGKLTGIDFYLYDSRDREKELMYWCPDPFGCVGNVYNTYQYYDNGKFKVSSMFDSKRNYIGCSICIKNDFDSLSKELFLNEKNEIKSISKYRYNSKHQLIYVSDSINGSPLKEPYSTTTYVYDSVGNLLKEMRDFPEVIYENHYDKSRRIILSEDYTYNKDLVASPYHKTEMRYQFDSLGNVDSYDALIVYYGNSINDSTVEKVKYQYQYEYFK